MLIISLFFSETSHKKLKFKEEIVALLRNGSTKRFVADRYGKSQVNLYNWLKKNNLDLSSQNI